MPVGTRSISDVSKILRISRRGSSSLSRVATITPTRRAQFVRDHVVLGLAAVPGQIGLDNPWTALALLTTPDEQLCKLSPLEALRGNDDRLKELTVRLARAAVRDGFG